MFPRRYFAGRYFAPRYFSEGDTGGEVVIPPTPGLADWITLYRRRLRR